MKPANACSVWSGLRACAGRLLCAWAAGCLAGCIFLPRTTQVYDADCRIVARQMVLEPVQIGAFRGCANEGCQFLVVGAAVTAAASLAISGSIVVAGNVAYWLERQASCKPVSAAPSASSADVSLTR